MKLANALSWFKSANGIDFPKRGTSPRSVLFCQLHVSCALPSLRHQQQVYSLLLNKEQE